MVDNVEFITYMKCHNILMTECKDMGKKLSSKMMVFPHLSPPKRLEKTNDQSLRYWKMERQTNRRTDKDNYWGPLQINSRSKIRETTKNTNKWSLRCSKTDYGLRNGSQTDRGDYIGPLQINHGPKGRENTIFLASSSWFLDKLHDNLTLKPFSQGPTHDNTF